MTLSAQGHVDDGGNPLWGPNTDYLCAKSPSKTLGEIFKSK